MTSLKDGFTAWSKEIFLVNIILMFASTRCLVMVQIQFSLIKKAKIGHPEHSLHPPPLPHPPTSDNISFLPYPPPLQGGRHMFITPYLKITKIFRIHRTVKKYSNNIRIFIMHDSV